MSYAPLHGSIPTKRLAVFRSLLLDRVLFVLRLILGTRKAKCAAHIHQQYQNLLLYTGRKRKFLEIRNSYPLLPVLMDKRLVQSVG